MTAARRTVAGLSGIGGDQPILAGPWLAEVGYELLYWIPFLTWAARRHPPLAERLVVVSRGGTASWYAGVAERYVELYDYVEPDQLQLLLASVVDETRGYRKQLTQTSLDDSLLAQVATSLGLDAPPILHPSTMFKAYWALVKEGVIHRKDTIFEHAPITPLPAESLAAELPDDFVAVRFYYNASFPDGATNRRFVGETIAALAATSDVVLLDPQIRFDDHADADLPDGPRIHRIDHLMTPSNNLGLQSAVIARARAFVSTYGGLSYLGPFLGVPTVAFYSDAVHFRPQHLEVAQRAFRAPPFGPFVALSRAHAELLGRVLTSPAVPDPV